MFPGLYSLFVLLILSGCGQPFRTRQIEPVKSAEGRHGIVVSAHPLASEAGLYILQAGGNAADAAIAVQFALAVVYPRAGNIGGGGFLMYRDANGQATSLDYRECAPRTASRDMFLDTTGKVIPDKSLFGLASAGVPGTVAGIMETYSKFGHLKPFSKLVEPAIHLAEYGFPITQLEADRLNAMKADFAKYNPYPIPFIREEEWKKGDMLIQPELAGTLKAIANEGEKAFYTGRNAILIDSLCSANGGSITKADLGAYKPVWREPLQFTWRDYHFYTMAPPSSGGILLHQILSMTEPYITDSLGPRNLQNVQVLVEAERRAFADRAVYLGDADFVHIPVDSITSPAYLIHQFSNYTPYAATPSTSIHKDYIASSRESYETTHLAVADVSGNVACITTTLNNSYGCHVWVPGGGYFLNDEMDDFSTKPGAPNLFGLIGGEANAIAPGKRMLSSMSPTIVEQDGEFRMALGSTGGSTIPTTVIQTFLNVAAYAMSAADALQMTRYHHQWLPDEIVYEEGAFSPGLVDSLEAMGYHLRAIKLISQAEFIFRDYEGTWHGAADRRGDDHATGW